MVLEGRLERSVIPLHMSEQLRSISAADIASANELINRILSTDGAQKKLTASRMVNVLVAGMPSLDAKRTEYQAMSKQLGQASRGVPGWLKAFMTFRVNKYRLEQHEKPIIVGLEDGGVSFSDVKPGATPAETLRELVADICVTRNKTVV